MNKLKKIALFSLLSLSVLSITNPSFAGKDKEEAMYTAVATWIMKSGIIKKLRIKAAVEKCKDIDWGKVAKTLQELVINKK